MGIFTDWWVKIRVPIQFALTSLDRLYVKTLVEGINAVHASFRSREEAQARFEEARAEGHVRIIA